MHAPEPTPTDPRLASTQPDSCPCSEAHLSTSADHPGLTGITRSSHHRKANAARKLRATGHPRETGRLASEPAPRAGGRPHAEPPTAPARAGPQSPARRSRRSERGDHSPIPQASASSLRDRVTEPSPGPGSVSIRARATLRPTSRRSRLTSARSASSSARGTVTISDASAVTRSSLHSPPLPSSLVPTPDSRRHIPLCQARCPEPHTAGYPVIRSSAPSPSCRRRCSHCRRPRCCCRRR
jgi:hypothetical protein